MAKRLTRRIFIIAVCAVVVLCMACPAFAAGTSSAADDYIFIGSQTFYEMSFTASGDTYSVTFKPDGMTKQEGDTCAVSFGELTYELSWWNYSGDLCSLASCIGNPALIDAGADNGLEFVFVLNYDDKNQCLFTCVSSFYNAYIYGTGDSGFTLSFSVPKSEFAPLMDDVSTVFTASIGMVGRVAEVFTSYPILYLPIVIGLCGIGVAFFNRIKQ